MREYRPPGSVRGARGDACPYRDYDFLASTIQDRLDNEEKSIMDTVIVYGRRGTTAHQDIPDTVKAEFDGVLSDIKIRQGKLEDAVIENS